MSIDLSGADAGSLSQTFDTTIGNTYTVDFLLSGNPAGPPSPKTLEVSATGGTTGLYSHDTTGSDLTTMVWTPETYSFLATSASTTITFLSTTAGPYGPALDNVVVSETVPTKDECKNGGWQSMIDNAGNSFKNQGDCVSYFATKGKNLGAVPAVTATEAANTADAATTSVKHANKHARRSTAKAERHAANVKGRQQWQEVRRQEPRSRVRIEEAQVAPDGLNTRRPSRPDRGGRLVRLSRVARVSPRSRMSAGRPLCTFGASRPTRSTESRPAPARVLDRVPGTAAGHRRR